MHSHHILLVEDDHMQRVLYTKLLTSHLGYQVSCAGSGAEALYWLKQPERPVDAIMLDLFMPDMDGKTVLPRIKERYPDIPVIILTASEDMDDAIEVMQLGAVDFLRKPVEPARLKVSLDNALRLHDLEQEVRVLRGQNTAGRFEQIIGHHSGLSDSIKLARRAADSDIPTLITGESGTGKEVIARAIHTHSNRHSQPFIAVNCGAIPKELVESTLFGHKKGAFTGAIADAKGKFREADGGTLFLDEVGELPLAAQVALLRVLQQKEVEPVGAGVSVAVNVRIIAATNRSLQEEVQKQHFREDLFYRLNVFPLHLPPLRERTGDIVDLCKHFLECFTEAEKKTIRGINDDAMLWLTTHHWPGNVRELENMLYRAVLMCDGNVITMQDIQLPDNATRRTLPDSTVWPMHHEEVSSIALHNASGHIKSLDEIKKEAVQCALHASNQNIVHAAKALGISPSTIHRYFPKYT